MITFLTVLATVFAVEGAAVPLQARNVQDAVPQYKIPGFAWATDALGKGGRLNDIPPGSAPLRVELVPKATVPNAKKVKVRYGPYNIIGMDKTSMLAEEGALWNYPDSNIPKPSENDFTIFGWQAGLEYLNGTDANINEGLWLHHIVHMNIGKTREDPTCAGSFSMPHWAVDATSSTSERMFCSGNERTYVDLTTNHPDGHVDSGYFVSKDDHFAMIVDMMNMNMDDRVVFLTVTYDYVDGFPEGWDNVKPVWLDANQCGSSDVTPPVNTGSFTIESQPWKPNFEGEIVGLMTHVHDGGASMEIYSDLHQPVVCDTKATYGATNRYRLPKRLQMGSEHWASLHISNMSQCTGEDLRSRHVQGVRKGQSWFVRAKYDYDLHAGNANAFGQQENVMAIALLYVRVPRQGVVLDQSLAATAVNGGMSATMKGFWYNLLAYAGFARLFGSDKGHS